MKRRQSESLESTGVYNKRRKNIILKVDDEKDDQD
jgi:hypothetical protein